jgi:hypothetical protein
MLYYVALYAQHKLLNGHLFLQGKLKTELATKAKLKFVSSSDRTTLLQPLGRTRKFPAEHEHGLAMLK